MERGSEKKIKTKEDFFFVETSAEFHATTTLSCGKTAGVQLT